MYVSFAKYLKKIISLRITFTLQIIIYTLIYLRKSGFSFGKRTLTFANSSFASTTVFLFCSWSKFREATWRSRSWRREAKFASLRQTERGLFPIFLHSFYSNYINWMLTKLVAHLLIILIKTLEGFQLDQMRVIA